MAGYYRCEHGEMDHPVFGVRGPLSRWEAWSWLRDHAAYSPGVGRIGLRQVLVRPGQIAASGSYLAQAWRWDRSSVRRFLAALTRAGFIRLDRAVSPDQVSDHLSDQGTDHLSDQVSDHLEHVISICDYTDIPLQDTQTDHLTDHLPDQVADQVADHLPDHKMKNEKGKMKNEKMSTESKKESKKVRKKVSKHPARAHTREETPAVVSEPPKPVEAPVAEQLVAVAAEAAEDPVDAAFRAYNLIADRCALSPALALTPGRRVLLEQRLREVGGLDGWSLAMAKLEQSEFICGDQRGWSDFGLHSLLRTETLARLMEDAYRWRLPNRSGRARTAADLSDRLTVGSLYNQIGKEGTYKP